MRRVGPALFVMAASLAPYLLTGYFDKRYFALLLISSSLASAVLFTPSARPLMLTVALGSSLGCICRNFLDILRNPLNCFGVLG